MLASCTSRHDPYAVPITRMGVKGYGDTTTLFARQGDTVYVLAQRLGVDMRAIIDANNLTPPYDLSAGQRLTIPAPPTVTVNEGDTLFSIAQAYKADQSELVRLNNLSYPYTLAYGQTIRLPNVPVASSSIVPSVTESTAPVLVDEPVFEQGAISVAADAPPTAAQEAEARKNDTSLNPVVASLPSAAATAALPSVPTLPPPPAVKPPVAKTATVAGAPSFSWPVNGSTLSGYGPKAGGRHNDGINIGAPLGTPVRAAAAGEVVYAGDNVAGFGNLILVRHQGGYATAYAHLQNPVVKQGESVAAGQAIASVGKTGNVSTPQLHFEVRKGTKPVNPKTYLP